MPTTAEAMTVANRVTCDSLTVKSDSITNAMCNANMALVRSKLAQDTLAPFTIPLTSCRTWNEIANNLPTSAASDDLGLDNATFGTGAPHLTAGDLKAAGATSRYARVLIPLPAEYDNGETVVIRAHAGMLTTVADTSCTLDVEAYLSDEESGISADLCATAAQSMNSLTDADLDFVITATSLVSGSLLDVRITVTCTDAATGTAVEPIIGSLKLLCDIKG